MDKDNAVQRVIEDLRAAATRHEPGYQLPSVRELMARHRVSPETVQRAVHLLANEGLIEVRPGRGSFVANRAPAPAPEDLSWQAVALGEARPGEDALSSLVAIPAPDAVPLSSGYPDPRLHPVGALGAALARAARRPGAWERGPVAGSAELRAWFAREIGDALSPADLTVCSGGQPALATMFRALSRPGDAVLVEMPTYIGAIAAARDAGLRVVPVPADHDGVRPDLLATAFARTNARLFYCQPQHANPHGATLAAARRPEVLATVRRADAFLIEDDWARGLTIDGTPPRPLVCDDVNGHVIYLRSLTKIAAPGLRIAAIGARGQAGIRLRSARVLDDFFVSGPLQEAALNLVTSPAWHRHLRTLRTELRTRRDTLADALRTHLPELRFAVPTGGLHLWVSLPPGIDDTELTAVAAAHGVIVFPGRPWFAAEPPAPYLRLTYGAAPTTTLVTGTHRLARALADVMSSTARRSQ
jgi:DNA-binding transcriptional MocR family regulator